MPDPPKPSDEPDERLRGGRAGSSAPPRALTVPAELDGERLDRALAALAGPDASRSRVQGWIKAGAVAVGGRVVQRPAHAVAAGDAIALAEVPDPRARPGAPPDLAPRVVHADAAIVVVDKPAGMVVHPSSTVRGRTLAEQLEARFGPLPSPQGADRPGIVHRLDAETSGLLVAARTAAAGEELKRQFREREVEKGYLAIVHGDPRFDADWIEAPLGRSPRSPERIGVVETGEGRPARTFYEVRERLGVAALLACRPVTGRTHQIRVHLEWIGHPVVGDKLYRGRRGRRAELPPGVPAPGRHALHAHRLAFAHPDTGERVVFEAPLPAELEALLARLR